MSRHASSAGVGDLLSELRYLAAREARSLAVRELAEAASPEQLLNAVNRHVPGGASQIPQEILGFIELARTLSPKTLVEVGTEAGGTHLLFGHALKTLEQTIAVDLRVRNRLRVRGLRRLGLRVDLLNGDSSSDRTLERIRTALGGRSIDVLFIDGDHSFRGAASDLLRYRPLVRPGGLIAFHDIVPDGWLRTGTATSAYAGEVPLIWEHIRRDFRCHEFVASWDQEGKGIGAIENDVGVAVRPLSCTAERMRS